jgi:tRNA(Ile)-lysidine synthase
MSVVKEALLGLNLQSFNLCVACSGGLDSTVLVEALIRLGFEPMILHINYRLRGEESDQDEDFVRTLAQEHQLKFKVVYCPKELTKGNGINLQDAARKFRHELFLEFVQQAPNNRVLLAHHADDQVETFFLQLMRGAGIFGLGGMHLERNGIIRPFLKLSKEELKNFALEHNIQWREDTSNLQNDYKRNQFRNIVVPELMQTNPELKNSIHLIQSVFRDTRQELKENLHSRLINWEKEFQISFEEWSILTLEEQLLCCSHFNWPTWIIERINALNHSELSSKIDNTPLFKTKAGFSWNPNFPEIAKWEFKSEEVEFLPSTFTKWEVYLDSRKCILPLIQSFAGSSDTIHSIGMNGKRNVFKCLKDAGIPEQWRNSYPVFKSGDKIVWIPGVSISKEFAANPSTSLIIKLSKV